MTIQAQILDLLKRLKKEFNTSIIMITHNLGVVAGMADRVVVMYGGRVAEVGTVEEIFEEPKHPYTLGLLRAVPRLDRSARSAASRRSPGRRPTCSASPRLPVPPPVPVRHERCAAEPPACARSPTNTGRRAGSCPRTHRLSSSRRR